MTNLEKLQKIASFRVDKVYDIKFDNGDIEHHEYETIRDLFPEYFAEIENALAYYERQQEYKAKWLVAFEIIKEKKVNVRAFKKVLLMEQNDDVKLRVYNSQNKRDEDDLTKEEYDILKEILK